jgi:hypothetical protein
MTPVGEETALEKESHTKETSLEESGGEKEEEVVRSNVCEAPAA